MDPIARFLNSEIVADFLALKSVHAKKDRQPDTLFFGINGKEMLDFRLFPFPYEKANNSAFYDDDGQVSDKHIRFGSLGGDNDILNQYAPASISAIIIDYGVITSINNETTRANLIENFLRVLKVGGAVYFPDLQYGGFYANGEAITAETRLEYYKENRFFNNPKFEYSLMQDPINPAARIMQQWVKDRTKGTQGEQVIVVKKIK